MNILHFGIKIKDKPSNYINKEHYLSSKPESIFGWEQKHYDKQILKANYNYDLNMMYFDSLDKTIFEKSLDKQIKKFKFKKCENLNALSYQSGIYMLVLDSYKQVYIGQSDNIKKRIMGHWNGRKSLERLIFGDVITSIISIDSFGALDTTRIYYINTYNTYELECKIVSSFDDKYLINRIAGGIGSSYTYTNDSTSAKLAVAANRKKRNFTEFIEIEKLKEVLGDDFKFYLERYPELNIK